MNKFNDLHGDEPTHPPIEWNSQAKSAHFKSSTSPPKTRPVVSYIMVEINHHVIDNGDIEVNPSDNSYRYNSESVPDSDTTLIKSIDNDEMDHIPELSHSEHNHDLLYVDLHMRQD